MLKNNIPMQNIFYMGVFFKGGLSKFCHKDQKTYIVLEWDLALSKIE